MSTYELNTIVSKQEAEALKELIFKRARERAQALTDDVQTDRTTSIRNDIMELARDSFVSSKNPFADKTEQTNENNIANREIGFAKRQVRDVKTQIKETIKSADVAKAEINSTMETARADLSKKTSFMGALNFLNSQASISLVNRSQKNFDAIA